MDTYSEDTTYQEARNLLGKVGLGGHAHDSHSELFRWTEGSYCFASLIVQKPHIIYLDEPTNHLDIESIDALAEAIQAFNGGIVLVSHDARLIKEAECRIWICGNKTVTPFDGDIDDYRDELIEEMEKQEALLREESARKERIAKEQREKMLKKHGGARRSKNQKRAARLEAAKSSTGYSKKPQGDAVAMAREEQEEKKSKKKKKKKSKENEEEPVVKISKEK